MRPLNPNLDKCVQRVCLLDARLLPKLQVFTQLGRDRGKFLMQCCSHTWCCQRTGGKKGKELGGHLWGASILARATGPLLTSLRACPQLPTHLNPIIPPSSSLRVWSYFILASLLWFKKLNGSVHTLHVYQRQTNGCRLCGDVHADTKGERGSL